MESSTRLGHQNALPPLAAWQTTASVLVEIAKATFSVTGFAAFWVFFMPGR